MDGRGSCACIGCHRVWNKVLPSATPHPPHGSMIDMSTLSSHSNSRRSDRTEESIISRGSTTTGLKASICLKLTIFVCLLVVLSSGVPALVFWLKTREQLLEEIERRLFTVSTLRQEQLRDYLYSETDKTELIGTRVIINNYLVNPSVNNKSMAEFDLRSAVEVISDFIFAAIYDTTGQLVISTDDKMFSKAVSPQVFESLQTDGLMLSYPMQTEMGWIYNVSRAIYQVLFEKDAGWNFDDGGECDKIGEVGV